MDKTILKFYKRRVARMDSRNAKFNEDAGVAFAYGIAKSMGIDTTDMTPKEVFLAIAKKGGKRGTKGMKNAPTVKRSSMKMSGKGKVTSGNIKAAKKKAELVNAQAPTIGMEVKGMSAGTVRHILDRARKVTNGFYNAARKKLGGKEGVVLRTFTSHGPDHIEQVIERSNQAADEIEKLIPIGKASNGFRFGKIDRKELMVSAQFHDTGMDGGDGYNYGLYLDSVEGNIKKNAQNYPVGEILRYEDCKDYEDREGDFVGGGGIRNDHGINSAIHVLQSANELKKMGMKPGRIALLAFAHTKSKSGIKDLSNPADWEYGMKRLHTVVDKYNELHPDNKIEFNDEDVFEGGKPNVRNIGSLASEVAAVRLGDANREAKTKLKTQQGYDYNIDKHPSGGMSADEEAAGSEISITDDKGVRHILQDGTDDPLLKDTPSQDYSKKVVLGERNMVGVSAEYNKKHNTLQENIELVDGNDSPFCTAMAIQERLGELNTINGIPRAVKVRLTGVASLDAFKSSKNIAKAYADLWSTVSTPLKLDKQTGKMVNSKNYLPGIEGIVLEFDDGTKLNISNGKFSGDNNKKNKQ